MVLAPQGALVEVWVQAEEEVSVEGEWVAPGPEVDRQGSVCARNVVLLRLTRLVYPAIRSHALNAGPSWSENNSWAKRSHL